MVHFARLRLTGFKSFIEPCELTLNPGLTGVVGPNGCGKSNLVEALRWAMGENSPRKMRGGEMDDVIFNGTASRPARNVAEVTIHLDNAGRDAPPAYNDGGDIEITRRIEREAGSLYRVNGREVRARDVQLLFADAASGAKSAALVGQGRVGELINAKPVQRRHLLEEAAGIAGLQSRRHEAELRLRAAEGNLARIADIMEQLAVQLDGLKRQARQATRYRRLSERIRDTEAKLLERRWQRAEAEVNEAEAKLAEAEARVAELTRAAAAAGTAQAEAAALLPDRRAAEAQANGEVHRIEVARVELEAEDRRRQEFEREVEARLAQMTADEERERALADDAGEASRRLASEAAEVEEAQAQEAEAERIAAEARDRAADIVSILEGEAAELTAARAAREAERAALARRVEELEIRRRQVAARAEEVRRELGVVAARLAEMGALAVTAEAAAAARAAQEEAAAQATAAAERRTAAERIENAARAPAQAAEAALARLEAETAALADVLGKGHEHGHAPVLDALEVEPGYETALAAALGEDLGAPAADDAPVHWRQTEPFAVPPPLPEGPIALASVVKAPALLARRLSQVGVADDGKAAGLAAALLPGQRLVTREGRLWRWDGYTVAVPGASAAATRLKQRQRLAELERDHAAAAARRDEAASALEQARRDLAEAATADAVARERLKPATEALNQARDAHAKLAAEHGSLEARRGVLEDHLGRLDGEVAEVTARHAENGAAHAALPPATEGEDRLNALRARLDEGRRTLAERMGAHELLQQAARARRARLEAIGREQGSWSQREAGARQRLGDLAQRRAKAEEDKAKVADWPARIAARRARLMDELSGAEAKRRETTDARVEAETRLAGCDRDARAAEHALGEGREDRVRRDAQAEQARTARAELMRTIAERLEVDPERLAELAAAAGEEATAASVDELAALLQRLNRERDGIGPVNLRAEIEAEEVERQHSVMASEKTDLESAIQRLRRGIGELNREGRERLMTAFKEIDGHFRDLFARLFGGGHAHIELVDSEDPLEAGLEIVASPPGKKLQTLSLLSGGEQALTAVALIFAQFLTNPSPICVLDEVDAPLDDANVDRFCTLLAEMARSGKTRFLVITHHPMTMSRMDRLFGVTMSERGVSQLVSVDLADAERLRATA